MYGGASLGYVIVSVSDKRGYSGRAASAVGFGAFGGGKYYFSSNTAVYAEVGYQSLSFLNIGVSFKFRARLYIKHTSGERHALHQLFSIVADVKQK
jgi:predicted porin